MSLKSEARVMCPSCGEDFDTPYWKSLNAELNPVEKELLLSGELFHTICTKCHAKHSFSYPILYHDMTHKVMIQYVPDEKDNESHIKGINAVRESVAKEFPHLDDAADDVYQYRIVNSLLALREKAYIFDCGLDDRIVEFLKPFYISQVSKVKGSEISEIVYIGGDVQAFLAFSQGKPVLRLPLDSNAYDKIKAEFFSEMQEKTKDCCYINQEWALGFFREQDARQ